jgi:hypothetical protein
VFKTEYCKLEPAGKVIMVGHDPANGEFTNCGIALIMFLRAIQDWYLTPRKNLSTTANPKNV